MSVKRNIAFAIKKEECSILDALSPPWVRSCKFVIHKLKLLSSSSAK